MLFRFGMAVSSVVEPALLRGGWGIFEMPQYGNYTTVPDKVSSFFGFVLGIVFGIVFRCILIVAF